MLHDSLLSVLSLSLSLTLFNSFHFMVKKTQTIASSKNKIIASSKNKIIASSKNKVIASSFSETHCYTTFKKTFLPFYIFFFVFRNLFHRAVYWSSGYYRSDPDGCTVRFWCCQLSLHINVLFYKVSLKFLSHWTANVSDTLATNIFQKVCKMSRKLSISLYGSQAFVFLLLEF